MFEALKRAKYETAAHYHVLNEFGFDTERLGGWKKASITGEVFKVLKKEGRLNEEAFCELFVSKLKSEGVI